METIDPFRRSYRAILARAAGVIAGLACVAFVLAAPAAEAQSGKIASCRIDSGGEVVFNGRCRFVPEGRDGSFFLESPKRGAQLYDSVVTISVAIIEPGVAEVRGLTPDGINSRWGPARRSTRDRACWVGDDFRICAR